MERQELVNYLKDVYELESQDYSLWSINQSYVSYLNKIKEKKDVVCWCEEFTEDTASKFVPYTRKGLTWYDPYERIEEPSSFKTLEFSYNEASSYLPPRYFAEFNELAQKNTTSVTAMLFRKTVADTNCSPNSKLRKEYQEVYTKRYNEELAQKQVWYEEQYQNIKKGNNEIILPCRNKTGELLEKMYSLDIIHPKYREFTAIAQIYEYFDTGRCDTLEGPYGAYNLYEQELRQNVIINRLEDISYQLEELSRTMQYVCSSLQRTNSLLSQISSQIGRIEANTACMTYSTQCIAYNTRIANQYNL